tara:strand:- start:3902 stop:4072 length:171 start_codon:yes stop_codon:yes gene_type:complete
MSKHLKITIENEYMTVSLKMKNPTYTLDSYYELCERGALALGYGTETVMEWFHPEQ